MQNFSYDNNSIDLMIRMRLVNVLIERLDLNLKDVTDTHDKKPIRTSTIDLADTENAKDKSMDEDDLDAPTVKKMKLEYFPLTVNVSGIALRHIRRR